MAASLPHLLQYCSAEKMVETILTSFELKSICFMCLDYFKIKKRVLRLIKYYKIKDGVGVVARVSISVENETPSISNSRELLFLNNLFNSRVNLLFI